MFLLRRKSDGKFFRNKGYHQDSIWRQCNKGEDDPRWVVDPSHCVPFVSKTGVKNSRGVSLGERPGLKRPTDNDREGWRLYQQASGAWYGKANTKNRRKWENDRFNELYEIIEINYVWPKE